MNDEQKIPAEQSTDSNLQPENMKDNTLFQNSIEETSKGTDFLDLVKRPERKFQPITIDKEKLNFLNLKTGSTIWSITNAKFFLGILQGNAEEVINDLKKEYNLK